MFFVKTIFVATIFLIGFVESYDNGVGKLPAMGWNTWYQFQCNYSETLLLEMIAGLKKYGLDKLGYNYINLDDCWALTDRDKKTNRVVPDPEKFPNGIPFMVNEAHKNGLKFGLYTDIGMETCRGRAGSLNHYEIDAQTYADWKIDFIKVDYCHITKEEKKEPWISYSNFSRFVNATGHHMLFSICNWGREDPWKWAPKISNSWRSTRDVSEPSFHNVLKNMEENEKLSDFAGLHNFNDPDILEVGVIQGEKKLSYVENRAHFGLWSLMAAPLLLANDLRNISSEILEIISNYEIIAIDQDELGIQGKVVKRVKDWMVGELCIPIHEGYCKWTEIWEKPLVTGKIAVGLFNHAETRDVDSKFFKDEVISVNWKDLGLKNEDSYHIRDVWEHKDLGVFEGEFRSTGPVKQHDIFMFVMTPFNNTFVF